MTALENTQVSTRLAATTASLSAWMKDDVLPFWARHGVNPKTGLAFEQMCTNGAGDDAAQLRVRVQLRQIFSFAHAATVGWLPGGEDLALRLWWDVRRQAAPDGLHAGLVHGLDPSGAPIDRKRDAYDHAFAVLALSWLRRATADTAIDQDLNSVLSFVDTHLTDSFGVLIEDLEASLPRRQNPQMHWYEASLALFEAAGREEGLSRAAKHRSFMLKHLLNAESMTIGEYFDDSWAPAAGAAGETVEPGHLAEWCWLLRRHETLSNDPRGDVPRLLLDSAMKTADPATGLLVDECDTRFMVRRATRRSWVSTELAKAWISEVEAGAADALPGAEKALNALDTGHLRRPFRQGWIDKLDDKGAPIGGPVPASILYHVYLAVYEAHRVVLR